MKSMGTCFMTLFRRMLHRCFVDYEISCPDFMIFMFVLIPQNMTPVRLLHMASLTSPGLMDKLASVQPGFGYKNRAVFDTECKY